jgi:hypothetical protein
VRPHIPSNYPDIVLLAVHSNLTQTYSATINDTNNNLAVAAMSNFGIPLTSSMSIGFAIGFMKG